MSIPYLCCGLLFCLVGSTEAKAQVGINNPNPNEESVLDLSNDSDKGLKMPKVATQAALRDSERLIYYFKNQLFYKTTAGYNAVSPFRYQIDGADDNNLYYLRDGKMNIGASDIEQAPNAKLQIERTQNLSLTDHGAMVLGETTGANLGVNNAEIQTRNNASAAPLSINESGGNLRVGSRENMTHSYVSGDVLEYDYAEEQWYDPIPTGTIIMWYGNESNVPTGWAICNGQAVMKSDSSGMITPPNLSGRFVVNRGPVDGSFYTEHTWAGMDKVALNQSQIPTHNHSVSDPGHTHVSRDGKEFEVFGTDGGGSETETGGDGRSGGGSGTHSAQTGVTLGYTGGNQAHENRPTYIALVFIIKL